MSYTVREAKANFSKLIREAESGKEVVITRGRKPVAKIVPLNKPARKSVPDMFEGQLWSAPDAFDPLTDEELRDWGLL